MARIFACFSGVSFLKFSAKRCACSCSVPNTLSIAQSAPAITSVSKTHPIIRVPTPVTTPLTVGSLNWNPPFTGAPRPVVISGPPPGPIPNGRVAPPFVTFGPPSLGNPSPLAGLLSPGGTLGLDLVTLGPFLKASNGLLSPLGILPPPLPVILGLDLSPLNGLPNPLIGLFSPGGTKGLPVTLGLNGLNLLNGLLRAPPLPLVTPGLPRTPGLLPRFLFLLGFLFLFLFLGLFRFLFLFLFLFLFGFLRTLGLPLKPGNLGSPKPPPARPSAPGTTPVAPTDPPEPPRAKSSTLN